MEDGEEMLNVEGVIKSEVVKRRRKVEIVARTYIMMFLRVFFLAVEEESRASVSREGEEELNIRLYFCRFTLVPVSMPMKESSVEVDDSVVMLGI